VLKHPLNSSRLILLTSENNTHNTAFDGQPVKIEEFYIHANLKVCIFDKTFSKQAATKLHPLATIITRQNNEKINLNNHHFDPYNNSRVWTKTVRHQDSL